ncbi:hypothetical protein SCHPADRAFT_993735 [Schizopora paradoxa]|uniref:Transmembrane protein n=1 Tax=Schizopora paradoxa TaxID=27342 RepID=A0A0H2SMH9_9AGAM|nr:hypothetical protein SCHPADRAFT_993735 [Schizopora paradoxa]
MITEIKGDDLPELPQNTSRDPMVFRAIVTDVDGSINEEQRHNAQGDGLPPDYDPATAPNRDASGNFSPSQQSTSLPLASPSQTQLNDKDWVETLRELQTNLKDLKQAKNTPFMSTSNPLIRKGINFSTFSSGKKSKKKSKNGTVAEGDDLGSITAQIEDQERLQNIRVHEQLVLEGMRRLARTHPDPASQAEWASRAENFSRALEEAKRTGNDAAVEAEEETVMGDIGKGLKLLVLVPVALGAATVFATGALFYGTGKLIVGIGHAMTFGKMRSLK